MHISHQNGVVKQWVHTIDRFFIVPVQTHIPFIISTPAAKIMGCK